MRSVLNVEIKHKIEKTVISLRNNISDMAVFCMRQERIEFDFVCYG